MSAFTLTSFGSDMKVDLSGDGLTGPIQALSQGSSATRPHEKMQKCVAIRIGYAV